MFRLWAKIFENNHMLEDCVIENDENITRTKKVLASVSKACVTFDLGEPIWLDANIAEFKKVSKTRFRADNFIEAIEFDYLEIQIIEED